MTLNENVQELTTVRIAPPRALNGEQNSVRVGLNPPFWGYRRHASSAIVPICSSSVENSAELRRPSHGETVRRWSFCKCSHKIAAKRADDRTSFPLVGCVELVGVVIEIAREADVLLAAHLREGAAAAAALFCSRLRKMFRARTMIGFRDGANSHGIDTLGRASRSASRTSFRRRETRRSKPSRCRRAVAGSSAPGAGHCNDQPWQLG